MPARKLFIQIFLYSIGTRSFTHTRTNAYTPPPTQAPPPPPPPHTSEIPRKMQIYFYGPLSYNTFYLYWCFTSISSWEHVSSSTTRFQDKPFKSSLPVLSANSFVNNWQLTIIDSAEECVWLISCSRIERPFVFLLNIEHRLWVHVRTASMRRF